MDGVVLNSNLKYVINVLNLEQRGKLLNALLGLDGAPQDEMVADIYQYIKLLQEDIAKKKQRMKEIGAKGNETRRLNKLKNNLEPDLFLTDNELGDSNACKVNRSEQAVQTQCENKRKVAKENNIKNINNLYISRSLKKGKFIPPQLLEVKSYIETNKLNVNAEEFLDFYEGKGWCMGQTPISRWQPIVRLWHKRTQIETEGDDEAYWSELRDNDEASKKKVDEDTSKDNVKEDKTDFFKEQESGCFRKNDEESDISYAQRLLKQTGRLGDDRETNNDEK